MNLKKYIWLAAWPIAFTACQEEALVENPIVRQDVFTIKGSVVTGTEGSRAQILLNGNNTKEEAFHWNAGDKFTLFQNTDVDQDWSTQTWTTHEFEIDRKYDDANPTASADFSTTVSPNMLIQGNSFMAVYPNLNVTDYAMNVVKMTLDQTLTDNSEASWTEYFKKNMFMMAEGEIQGSTTTTSANFEQLCGLIRITYKNDTNEDKHLKGIFLNSEWGYEREYFINIINEDGKRAYNQENIIGRDELFGLTFTGEEGALVPAGGSSDFYILFFPTGGTLLQEISVVGMNNELISTPKYLKDGLDYVQAEFQSGKCYWMNVTETELGLMWTNNRRSVYVKNQDELESALAMEPCKDNNGNPISSDIYLSDDITISKPLMVNNPVRINMQGHTLKVADNCTISKDKNPSVQNAVIYATSSLFFVNGTIEGPASSTKHETLICASDIRLEDVTIDTKKILNAIKSESTYSYMQFMGQTSVVTPEQGVALNIIDIMSATVNIGIDGTIDGDVNLQTSERITDKYYNDIEINFMSGNIDGNLSVIDTGGQLLEKIQVDSSVSISETSIGWEGVTRTDLLTTIKTELETYGRIQTYVSSLTINKDVIFELDGSKFDDIFFRIENLMGKGTITFKNTSDIKNLYIECEGYLSGDVKFVFDGEFTKHINVTTDNLGLIESAKGTDNVNISLSKDVVIDRQYVISQNLACAPTNPEEGQEFEEGRVEILLNGHDLTTSNTLTDAAFWVKGGYFAISNYGREVEPSVSTFKSNGHAIKIGASGLSSERIDVYVRDNIEMESVNGHCFYLDAGGSAESYRAVLAMSMADKNRSVNSTVVGYDGTSYSDTDENVDLSLRYVHVESLNELENALKLSCVDALILTKPLVVSGTKSIDLKQKPLVLSEDFFTKNPTAVAGLEGVGNLTILNGSINGCQARANGKYLIKFTADGTANSLSLYGVVLDGHGVSNGVYLENSTFKLGIGSTNHAAHIHVANGGYALDLKASLKPTQAFIGSDDDPYHTSINGKVRFTYDAFDSTEWSGLNIAKADVFGELEKEGTNAANIVVEISESARVSDSNEVSSWPIKGEE